MNIIRCQNTPFLKHPLVEAPVVHRDLCTILQLAFARISAIRMFFLIFPQFKKLGRFPLKLFFTSISSVRTLPPWHCFLPVFQRLGPFPVELAFYQHFSSWNVSPLKLLFTSASALRMLPPPNCFFV